MIGVFLLHSETYYGYGDLQLGIIFRPFYVNAFFFVSGYLLFNKYNTKILDGGGYCKALENILYRLIIPTLVFSSVIFVPKMLFHSEEISIASYIINVFGGTSFWFTSALTVAQLALLTIMLILRRRDIWSYLICSVVLFTVGWFLNQGRTGNNAEAFFPWFWKTGIEYTLIMSLGGVYLVYEQSINRKWKYVVGVASVIYCIATFLSFQGATFNVMGLGGRCDIIGGFLILAGITLVIAVCRVTKDNTILRYIGQNSILFYFLSGVFPAFVGALAKAAFPHHNYLITVAVAIISVSLAWTVSLFINRFAPFLVDFRKISR